MSTFGSNMYELYKAQKDVDRKQQALRMADMGLPRLASQLYHWNEFQLTPEDLDNATTGIDD